MFLVAKKFIFDIDERDKLKLLFKQEYSYLDLEPQEITFKIMTWRKANAIHKWFVNNVQDGDDDCSKRSSVSTEDMKYLLGLVTEVLSDHSKAKMLLPTQAGFFYGDTEYGDWYFENLKETETILKEALKPKNRDYEYYYQSSW